LDLSGLIVTFCIGLISIVFLIVAFYIWIYFYYRRQIYTLENVPPNTTALVLGAGLEKNGGPSDILLDRLITTRDLITITSPDLVILSGAESPHSGNEPRAMADFLNNSQMEKSIVVMDEQGYSTFHSLINMHNNSHIQQFTIISQKFHLTRALMISNFLGLKCVGLAANNMTFATWKVVYWYLREILATPFNIGKIIFYKLSLSKLKS
jgi:SanA protein